MPCPLSSLLSFSPSRPWTESSWKIAPFGGHLWYCNAVFAQWGQASWNFFGLLLGTSATMIIFIRSSRKKHYPNHPPPPQKKDLIPTHVITSCNHYGQVEVWKSIRPVGCSTSTDDIEVSAALMDALLSEFSQELDAKSGSFILSWNMLGENFNHKMFTSFSWVWFLW